MAKYCPFCVSKIDQGDCCPFCNHAYTYQIKGHHLRPGTLLNNKYLVGRVLGEGGFGITYVGRDLTLDMKVAIKEYYPAGMAMRANDSTNTVSLFNWSFSNDFAKGKEQFIREAQTIAKMDKESAVVTVRDFFEQNNSAYIVMEFVEGDDLKKIIRQTQKPIPANELLDLVEPVFGALDELHSIGLIHRDISPDNIMIEDGRARLIDFGCARETLNDKNAEAVLKHGFSPVEQYENANMGPWTDVYAMAATIYFCITGKLPPKATERLVKDELQPPSALGVKLLPKQEAALMRALAVDRSERFQSMEEFGKDLFVHRNKYKLIAGAAVAVAAVAVAVLLIFKPGTRVETMQSARTVTQVYTAADQLSAEEQSVMDAVEAAAAEITLKAGQSGSVARLVNTTGKDFTGVRCNFRIFDEEGTIVYDSSMGGSFDWPADGVISPSYYYAGNDGVDIYVQLNYKYEDKSYRTAFIPIEAPEAAFSITLVTELPARLTYKGYSSKAVYEIDSFESSYTLLTEECSGKVYFGGSGVSGEEKYAYLKYEIRDKDGVLYENGNVSMPEVAPGEKFRNVAVSFWLPHGEYYMTLMDYDSTAN